MQRDRSLDQVRGVAILLVMLGHCLVLNGLDRQDPFIYDVIKSIQMPLFMLISGVVAAISGLGFKKLKKRAACARKGHRRRADSHAVYFFTGTNLA